MADVLAQLEPPTVRQRREQERRAPRRSVPGTAAGPDCLGRPRRPERHCHRGHAGLHGRDRPDLAAAWNEAGLDGQAEAKKGRSFTPTARTPGRESGGLRFPHRLRGAPAGGGRPRIWVVFDNLNIHRSKELKRWLAAQEG